MNARELLTPSFVLIVLACFVGCVLLGLGVLGGLFVCSALAAGWTLQHIGENKQRIDAEIERLPAQRRRRARVVLVLLVVALSGYGGWIAWSADEAREDHESSRSLTGGTPLYPQQPIEPVGTP
jgi:hypothetical protein